MLCRKLRQSLIARPLLNNNVQYNYLFIAKFFSKKCFFDNILKSEERVGMSSFRLLLRDFSVMKLWGAWKRSLIVNSVVRRCKSDGAVREVMHLFRHTILRPRRTLLLCATTAAFRVHAQEAEKPPSCEQSIPDEDLEALVTELESMQQLSRSTLYCSGCGKRFVIEKKLTGVVYCACKEPAAQESYDGWKPYMEAEDVIIWRKEHKEGQGLYAYKVYGRYRDVRAQDFAAVQVDGAYRRAWDAAVASLSVVEREANGLVDQAVLHWEVLWPRLFANRDYVYIRRHKEFEVKATRAPPAHPEQLEIDERPNVHSLAKRRSREMETRERRGQLEEAVGCDNRMFVILSRSCEHPNVPETKHAIRVAEYWSHMVVRTTHGSDKPGMEFVLTYYDEPAVGGLPTGVATWATGRAAPAYLLRMRRAAAEYQRWRVGREQELPDFVSADQVREESREDKPVVTVREQDMESCKDGPELESSEEPTRDQSTQTSIEPCTVSTPTQVEAGDVTPQESHAKIGFKETPALEGNVDKPEGEDVNTSNTGSWWRDDEDMKMFLLS